MNGLALCILLKGDNVDKNRLDKTLEKIKFLQLGELLERLTICTHSRYKVETSSSNWRLHSVSVCLRTSGRLVRLLEFRRIVWMVEENLNTSLGISSAPMLSRSISSISTGSWRLFFLNHGILVLI